MLLILAVFSLSAFSQEPPAGKKLLWKPVDFVILKFNGGTPRSWSMYHAERRGWILVHLWKRYLLVDLREQKVFDLDPQKLIAKGDNLEWSLSELPEKSIAISEWNERDIGSLRRTKFRFGSNGSELEFQLPLKVNGQPVY